MGEPGWKPEVKVVYVDGLPAGSRVKNLEDLTLNQSLSQESYHFKPVVGHIVNGLSDIARGGATPAGKQPSHSLSPKLSTHAQDGTVIDFEL